MVGDSRAAEGIVMSREKPNDDPRQQTDSDSFKQTDKPWKQPVEKEQGRKGARKSESGEMARIRHPLRHDPRA